MSTAAQAYARVSQSTATPREIEAQALLKAARQLQDAVTNWDNGGANVNAALLFNRKLWSIFLSAATSDDNPQTLEIRQNIANIGTFVMTRIIDIQLDPQPGKLRSLIEINRTLAAGLSGRG